MCEREREKIVSIVIAYECLVITEVGNEESNSVCVCVYKYVCTCVCVCVQVCVHMCVHT